ncbi:DUF4124 domain-containing protein [Rhodanobacter umsongensis]|uniref:DUF4124 domain-containing protein n=1 Tax=Rhodanobacter umsongensis TaxID=633153 RepID=A0ABW0JNL5_9GAMM
MSRSTALLCLALLVRAMPAQAQTEIHRCIGPHGGAVFTDQPCAALQATPVNPSAAPEGDAAPTAPPLVLCAASLDHLRESVVDAFASRDANRLAGLILWNGYARGAAIADIRSLGELMKQPLLDVDIPGEDAEPAAATPGSSDPFVAGPAPSAPPADQLVLHTAGSGNPREIRFGIARQAGCLWLRYRD